MVDTGTGALRGVARKETARRHDTVLNEMQLVAYIVDGGTTALLIYLLYTERVARQRDSDAFRRFSMRMIEYVAEIVANRHKPDGETRNVMRPDVSADDYFKDKD